MPENGTLTNKMDKGCICSKMKIYMKENSKMDSNMEMEYITITLAMCTKEGTWVMLCMVMDKCNI